ncbi:MAG: hypothetical protein AAGB01_05875 [Cyanobacteria bacterium P01_F01_bin.42]
MNPFSASPPEWTRDARHARQFRCPQCQMGAAGATQAWINRRAPVTTEDSRRIWQEFYLCQCGKAWWDWSSNRPCPPNSSNASNA